MQVIQAQIDALKRPQTETAAELDRLKEESPRRRTSGTRESVAPGIEDPTRFGLPLERATSTFPALAASRLPLKRNRVNRFASKIQRSTPH